MVVPGGFEPPTRGSSGRCSTELSYSTLLMWSTVADSNRYDGFCRAAPKPFGQPCVFFDDVFSLYEARIVDNIVCQLLSCEFSSRHKYCKTAFLGFAYVF